MIAVGTCPGVFDFKVFGASSFGRVAFFHGRQFGQTQIQPCPGVILNIANARFTGATMTNGKGEAVLRRQVPKRACGRTLVQAIDLKACVTSNIVKL